MSGDTLSVSINDSGDSTELTVTIGDIVLEEDNELLMLIDLESEEELLEDGVTPYQEGQASFNAGIVLTEGYPTLQEFTASADFQAFLENLQTNFAAQVTTDTSSRCSVIGIWKF